MTDVDDRFKFSLVNNIYGARQAQTVYGAEGPWLPRPYASPFSTYPRRRKPAFSPMVIKLVCVALKDRCTDIASEVYPHYKDTYPGGVREMTALDLELSEETRAVKIRWFENTLERLLKLQSRIASSAFRQCAVSSFTPSTFLLSKGPCWAACFSEATCTDVSFTLEFLVARKNLSMGEIRRICNNFWNSASKKHGAGEHCCTKRACGRFWRKILGKECGQRNRDGPRKQRWRRCWQLGVHTPPCGRPSTDASGADIFFLQSIVVFSMFLYIFFCYLFTIFFIILVTYFMLFFCSFCCSSIYFLLSW